MATIEELEAQAEAVEHAERIALVVLGEAMREIAVNLPDGSKLALDFAKQAQKVAGFADGTEPALWGGFTMNTFVRDCLEARGVES